MMAATNARTFHELKQQLSKFQRGERVPRTRTSTLGKLFGEISNKIEGCSNKKDVISYLYTQFNGYSQITDMLLKREFVLDQLLSYLIQINKLSAKKENSNLISIPLYDMRIVGELTNLIVIHGLYSIVPSKFLIPLEQRNIRNFKTPKVLEKIDFNEGRPILKNVLHKFTEIFESSSDLKDLILIGTGFTDALTIAIVLTIDSAHFSSYIDRLEAQSSTYQLISFYSLLYKNSKMDPKYATFVLSLLSKQLMKPNGVESLIDLTLGLRENQDIDTSKISYVVQALIYSKPMQLGVIDYFNNIFDQIYKLLVFVDRSVMNTVLHRIIADIYKRNKAVIFDFFFRKIWTKLDPKVDETNDQIVLTNEVDLNNSFNVCISMARFATSSDYDMINDLFGPIIVTLWYYSNYQRKMGKDFDIVLNLIKNVFVIGDLSTFIDAILYDFLDNKVWTFDQGENSLTYIKYDTNETNFTKEKKLLQAFDDIDFNIETFVMLVTKLDHVGYLGRIVKTLLYLSTRKFKSISNIEISINKVIELKLLHAMLNNFKSSFEDSPMTLIFFAKTYLEDYFEKVKSVSSLHVVEDEDSDDEDEGTATTEMVSFLVPVLEFVSTLTLPPLSRDSFASLQELLEENSKYIPQSIKYITDKIMEHDKFSEVEEKANKFDIGTALKQLNDQSPSIRVYALDKLTSYTVTKSEDDNEKKQVSTKYTVDLLLSQLKDSEPYVYLSTIRNLVSVLSFDKSFLTRLIEFYSQSTKSIDEKLRVGEVLTRFVAENGKVLTDGQVKEIVYMCIDISRAESKLQEVTKDNKDTKMKMSSLSILGSLCFNSGFGITACVPEIADLVHGIITFESDPELRRAAVVVVTDIIRNDNGLEILKNYGERLQILLGYVSTKDTDFLVCQFSVNALNLISESFDRLLNTSN